MSAFHAITVARGSAPRVLNLVKMVERVEMQTHRSFAILIDMKVRFHLCKMMYGLYWRWEMRQLLLSPPIIYGVWHPYKYARKTICTFFHLFLKLVGHVHHCFVAGDSVYHKPALLHMDKSALGWYW